MKINTVEFVDCRKGLESLPDNFADHSYLDMPFELDFTKIESMYNRKKDKVIKGYKEPKDYSKKIGYSAWLRTWIPDLYRVLKPNACTWMCTGWSHEHEVRLVAEESGFHLINQIIWRYQFGVWTTKKFVSRHYPILFFVKNPKNYHFDLECRYGKNQRDVLGNVNYRDREDVWVINRPFKPGKKKNANEQPIKLPVKALQYTTKPGNIILDPFMGGGTTAVACKMLGRNFIGFELNKNLKPHINERLKNVT